VTRSSILFLLLVLSGSSACGPILVQQVQAPTPYKWEVINEATLGVDKLERLWVGTGWLYKSTGMNGTVSLAFVPYPAK